MTNKSSNKTKKMKAASEKAKGEKNAKKSSRPRSSEMVLEALAALKERKGSSLQAIKKYITSTYHIDMSKQSFHIKKYIKSAVEDKEIVRTKGNGASGRFRLPTKADTQREKQKNMPKKPPSKKQLAVKPSGTTKKNNARKKSAKEMNVREKPSKNSVDKKGGKATGLRMRGQSAAPKTKNSKNKQRAPKVLY